MSTKHLVRPELQSAIELLPKFEFSPEIMPAIRKQLNDTLIPSTDYPDVTVKEIYIENPYDGHQVRILIYTPDVQGEKPGLFHTHGGGYVVGCPEVNDFRNKGLSSKLGAVIVSVAYRLAPEYHFPLPQEDSYAALKWFFNNASELKVDSDRIAIYGESAGGGMAATVSIMARDRKEMNLCHQFLIYPMLDDRNTVKNENTKYVGEFFWTVENNYFGWQSMLGKTPGSSDISAYAAASRVSTTADLPSTFIAVGALDLFLHEDIDYAQRLMKSGVPTELHVYPGAFHNFDFIDKDTEVFKQFETDFIRALKSALEKK